MAKRLIYLAILAGVAASAIVVAVGGEGSGRGSVAQAAARPAALTPFSSCDRLRDYLRRHMMQLRGRYPMPLQEDGIAAAGEGAQDSSAPAAPEGQTNVQEEGVDEPDLVKVSGSTLYAIAGNRLRSVDLSGPEPAVLGSIELPDGPGAGAYADQRQLLLAGPRGLVITHTYDRQGPLTLLTTIDLADPAAPRELATQSVEGDYVSARLTGNTARVVISAYPEMPVADSGGHGRAWMPRTVVRDRVTHMTTRGSLMPCEQVRKPSRFSGTNMLTVLTVDLPRGLPAVDSDAVMAGGQIVYASPTSLYVATQRWLSPPVLLDDVAGAPGVAGPIETEPAKTEIHRFDIADPDSTRYAGSGVVDGYMLDQWSMSEQDGVLRVASTTSPPWGEVGIGESQSFVTSLRLEGDRLERVGRVGGLGRGENIYAVRFIGDLGYVVTFRQVDPLYVLDLSDPRDPRKVGELKIPGYSAYLHPVGDGLLLGVGQDATEQGMTTGVQVSLFDVTDPTAPVRVDHERLGAGTMTEVEQDHHAFTYSDQSHLAVLPITAWSVNQKDFNGAVGVRVDPVSGLERTPRTSQGGGYRRAIRRTVIVDGRVFTISDSGVAEHDRASLARLAFTPFAGD